MSQKAVLAGLALAALCAIAVALPHGSGWVPSGGWSSPAAYNPVAVNPWPVSTGWTDYSVGVGVDPWASQVVKKKPSYASLYPWAEKPSYRPAPSYPTQSHGGDAGWTRIPVLDDEGGSQWVAWVPEEFGDFVIVRKDKVKPKKKKVEVEEEEEEEEPEPPKPKKKKVKTIVEEEEPEPEPPKPKKKVKTIVEEDAPQEPKKTIKTIVEDEAAPKKTTKTTVTTEEEPKKESSSVTKTETIEQASTEPESVSVPAPAK